MSGEGFPRSPRIAALQRALAAGDADALDRFWRALEAQGAPMIEPLMIEPLPVDGRAERGTDDVRQMLVTFVWRGDPQTRNVVVIGGLAGWDFAENQMQRLSGTDLWFRSYQTRADVRTEYRLAPNLSLRPLAEVGDDWPALFATFQPDPFNPRRVVSPRDQEIPERIEMVSSVLEMPAAPAQPYQEREPETPAGRVALHRLRSQILGNERRIWVYTPPAYATAASASPTSPSSAYPLLVLFDGFAYQHLVPTPTILDNLIAAGLLPSLIAVFVDNLQRSTRLRELLCHPPFNRFLAEELLPWLRARYPVTHDPSRIVVGGASGGGLAGAFAALAHPELFGAVLSQSGAFWWDDGDPEWLTRQFAASAPQADLRFYLEAGLLEGATSVEGTPSLLASNRNLRDVLRDKGYTVTYAEHAGFHDFVRWRGTLADGLIALLGAQQ